MLENLAARMNGDANLVRRGKHVTTTFLIAIDNTDHLVSVSEGKITGIKPGPFITPNYSFALDAQELFLHQCEHVGETGDGRRRP